MGFGPVTGSLIAGLVIGDFFHVPVSDTAKQFLFLLFMFGIGCSAGPRFIRGIQDGGWKGHAAEVCDRELLDIPQATFDVEVTRREVSGRTLAHLRGHPAVRGVFPKTIQRGAESLPVAPGTVLRRGDLLTLHGLEPAVDRVAAMVGNVSRPTLGACRTWGASAAIWPQRSIFHQPFVP